MTTFLSFPELPAVPELYVVVKAEEQGSEYLKNGEGLVTTTVLGRSKHDGSNNDGYRSNNDGNFS